MVKQSSRSARPAGRHEGAGRPLPALAVVHPVPSAINGALVASLALVAGAGLVTALTLAVAMLAFQFSIGSLNDLVDSGADRLAKPRKPIPAGLVSARVAAAIAVAGGALGLTLSAGFGFVVFLLGAAGYASGVAYDVFMRRWGWGWLCYSAAFPLLLAWTWVATAGILPPGWVFLLPMAALAGPVVHLANSLVDVGEDERTGQTSLVTRLGAERARWLLAMLTGVIYVLAWAALAASAPAPLAAFAAALLATFGAALGVAGSWHGAARLREYGWLVQATALATLAVALLAAGVGS